MKKALILGGSYFVGRHIAEGMLDAGIEVWLLNRAEKPFDSRAHQLSADREKPDEVKRILSGMSFDTVVDVSCVNPQWASDLCEALDFSHVENFIYISSGSVYALDRLPIPVKEEDEKSENTYWGDYGKNKYASEQVYSEKIKNTGAKLLMLRPPYLYGEYNYVQRESYLFHSIESCGKVLVPASDPLFQFLYAGDLARLVMGLPEKCNEKINILNVGDTAGVRASEWARACARAMGAKNVEIILYDHKKHGRGVRDYFPLRDYDYLLDVSKQQALLPTVTSFDEGLRRSFEWYNNERDNIPFKPAVEQNRQEILAEGIN